MSKRRFEFKEGTSDKFWEIELQGSALTIRFGRCGANGQTQLKQLASPEVAQKEQDKLINEKTKKGYREVGEGSAAAAPVPAPVDPQVAAAPVAPAKPAKARSATRAEDKPIAVANEQAEAPAAAPAAPAVPTAEEENRIFWTDELKKLVYPRRGGMQVPIRALPSKAKAWAKVQAALKEREKWFGRCKGEERGRPLAALVERMSAPEMRTASPEEDADLLAALCFQPKHDIKPEPEPGVDALVLTGGHAHATRAVLLALERSVVEEGPTIQYEKKGDEPIYLASKPKEPNPAQWAPGTGRYGSYWFSGTREMLARMRELLVLASPDQYEEALAGATAMRAKASDLQHLGMTFLFPGQSEWVVEGLKLPTPGGLVLASAKSKADVANPNAGKLGHQQNDALEIAVTLCEALGTDAASLIVELEKSWGNTDDDKAWTALWAAVGSDATIRHLIEKYSVQLPAVTTAIGNQPRRMLRMLAEPASVAGKEGEPARRQIGIILRRYPTIVDELLPSLPEAVQKLVAKVRSEAGEVIAEANAADVPRLLAEPPWTRKRMTPPVVKDVKVELPHEIRWKPGERDRLMPRLEADDVWDDKRCEEALKRKWLDAWDFVRIPAEHAAELAPFVATDRSEEDWPRCVALHERVALPFVHKLCLERGGAALAVIKPVASTSLAPMVAESYLRKKSLRADAREWISRHPKHAAAGVLAQALGQPSKAREEGEAILRLLAASGHKDEVLAVADQAGVRAAVEQLLALDPCDLVPAKLPKLPGFVDPGALPPPVLKDNKGSLPKQAVEAMLTMLAFSPIDEPYPGLAVIKEACTPQSLARFAWGLFDAWLMGGAPNKELWCMNALGPLGDDECARKLAKLIREWPGESAHARAVSGLAVLEAMGSDVALMLLNGIAEKVHFKGLQDSARERIASLAEALGLKPEQLADRLAPDLGLDDDGSLSLDFGPRQFRVGFDEQLAPYAKDSAGARLKDLPKPIKSDDEEKAREAVERWKALKKDAKTVARLQILRLELAMCNRRRFPVEDFQLFFVKHPLVFHIVRRLVWGVYEGDELKATFRVAEDRTLADMEDAAFHLPAGATVGIPHVLELSKELLSQWSQRFAEYELLQPFPQLGRPVFEPTARERESYRIERVKDLKVPTGAVVGLEARGWRKGENLDGGAVCWMQKQLPGELLVCIEFHDGLVPFDNPPEQKLETAAVTRGSASYWHRDDKGLVKLGDLDPIVFSEIVRDLEGLKSVEVKA